MNWKQYGIAITIVFGLLTMKLTWRSMSESAARIEAERRLSEVKFELETFEGQVVDGFILWESGEPMPRYFRDLARRTTIKHLPDSPLKDSLQMQIDGENDKWKDII